MPASFTPKDERHDYGGSVKTIQTSRKPIRAPANYKTLPERQESDKDDLSETWAGSGIPTQRECQQCRNVEGNMQIYGNWGTSYPNGNKWEDWEVVCGKCGVFSFVHTFREG